MRAKKGSQLLKFMMTTPLSKKGIDDITDGLQYTSDEIISTISQKNVLERSFMMAWMSKEAL